MNNRLVLLNRRRSHRLFKVRHIRVRLLLRSSGLLVFSLVPAFVGPGVVFTSMVIVSLMIAVSSTVMVAIILVSIVVVMSSITVHVEVTRLEVDRGQALL